MDAVTAAGLTTREVRTGSRGGETTRIVVARRTYPTDRADLWDALTTAERIPRWFLPVSGELRPGGRYQLEGNAGGTVERCEAPQTLALTWEFDGQISWVVVTLTESTERDGGTELELEHEAVVPPEFWEQFGPGAVGVGWDSALWSLATHLEGGTPPPHDDPEFVGLAAPAWAEAAIADGDDSEQARAAAERTYAFYTGDTGDTGATGDTGDSAT